MSEVNEVLGVILKTKSKRLKAKFARARKNEDAYAMTSAATLINININEVAHG